MSEERRRKPLAVSEVLASYLEDSGLGERLEQVSVLDDWAERVGEGIAGVADPLRLADDVLFVGVKSSAWLMELRMMEVEIRRRLNEGRTRGRIEKIRFVLEGGEPEGPRPGRWGRR